MIQYNISLREWPVVLLSTFWAVDATSACASRFARTDLSFDSSVQALPRDLAVEDIIGRRRRRSLDHPTSAFDELSGRL